MKSSEITWCVCVGTLLVVLKTSNRIKKLIKKYKITLISQMDRNIRLKEVNQFSKPKLIKLDT
jgi:hypothetical protein